MQSDYGGESYTPSGAFGVSAPVVQRAPASGTSAQGAGNSRAPAMPLVHPFGRTPPPVQREIQAGATLAPLVSFGSATNRAPGGSAPASSADTLTLRRMPSIAASPVIQRAPESVTYISPLASVADTIQRSDANDAKAGSKKEEKKSEEKAEAPDLDTLAKQILPLLKRMLVIERERHIRR